MRSPDIADLNARFLESSGQVVMEAENGISTAGSSHAWQPQTTQQGYGGDSYLRGLPDIGDLDSVADLADSPHLAFPLQISTPASYTVWVRGMAPDTAGDSLHIGLDGATGSAQALTGFTPNEWSWASVTLSNTQATIDLTTSTTYTLDLWLREDGLRVDRVLLITDTNYIPTGVGPAESPREVGSGSSLDTHTVNYNYDPLNRLTAASYSGSLTANYGYQYDTLGNRMSYTATLTNTVVTTYTYNLANRLSTAKSDDTTTTWYYVYDNNGSRLQQLPGGLTPANGAVQYSYDQSNRLIQVESHDGTAFQLQAEMVYDGRGNRLQAIAYAAGSTITASYTLDPRSGLPLIVDNGTNRTTILYGQAAIGEYSSAWRYYLGDAQLSVRQLVDESGTVTQAQTYAPFGILLNQAGNGGGLFGYKGGQSSTNGLWYFGNGYFDPHTGQFISQNGDATSPLATANAVGFFLVPVLFIGWRRRKGKKRIHPATLLFLGILLAATLASCVKSGGDGQATGTPEAPVIPPTGADDATPTNTQLPPVVIEVTPEPPQSTAEPTPTITATPTCDPTSTSDSTQPPLPTQNPNYHPPIHLQDWEQGILASVITLENIGQPIEFLQYSAWILRNRFESNQFPNDAASLVFSQGQYDSVPTWFSQNSQVLTWLNQYPSGQEFTVLEVSTLFYTSVGNRFQDDYNEAFNQIGIVFGESTMPNPTPGGLYVGHVDTSVAHLEEQRLASLGGNVVYGRIDGRNNKTLIWTNHNSGCCYFIPPTPTP